MNQELKFISLLSDTTFKYLWKNEITRPWLEKVILEVTDINIKDFTLVDNELNTGNDNKDYRLDILLKKDDHTVSIEMNQEIPSNLDDFHYLKNHSYLYHLAGDNYLSGDKYTIKYVTQINFNNCSCPIGKNIRKLTFEFTDKEYDITIEGIKDYEIYLDSFKGICYTNPNKKDYYLSMFTAKSFNEMKTIAKCDKEALAIVSELEKLSQDKYFGGLYDAEIVQKKLENSARLKGYQQGFNHGVERGIEQGVKQEKQAMILNMYHDNVNLNKISEYTKLSLAEINKIIAKEN